MENAFGLSPFGLDFIKKHEGYTPAPQWDYRQWSSGFGTKAAFPGERIDKAEAERRLNAEIAPLTGWIKGNITAPLAPNQTDALLSFGYNLGADDLDRLKNDINAQNWQRVADRMLTFNKAGGEVNPGLVNRRRDEANLFLGKTDTGNGNSRMLSPFGMPQSTNPDDPLSVMVPPMQPKLAAALGGTAAAPGGGPVPLNIAPTPNMRYSKLADALLAAAAGAKPRGWGELLNSAGDLALGYSLANNADNAQKAHQASLSKVLGGASTPEDLTAALISSGDPELVKAGVSAKLAPKVQTKRFEVNPVTGEIYDTATGQPLNLPGRPSAGASRSPMSNPLAEKERQKTLGKSAAELEINKPKAQSSLREGLNNFNSLVQEAEALKTEPGRPNMTGVLQGRSWMPTVRQDTADAEARLKTIKSKIAFSVLQAMREASKTGGALGAVSDKETELLQNNIASLDTLQGDEAFAKKLDDIVEYAMGAQKRLLQAYKDTYGEDFAPAGATAPGAPAQAATGQPTAAPNAQPAPQAPAGPQVQPSPAGRPRVRDASGNELELDETGTRWVPVQKPASPAAPQIPLQSYDALGNRLY